MAGQLLGGSLMNPLPLPGRDSVALAPLWLGAEILEVTSVTQGSKIPKRQMPGGALAWVDLLEIMILLIVLSRAVSSLESQPLSTKAVKTGRK